MRLWAGIAMLLVAAAPAARAEAAGPIVTLGAICRAGAVAPEVPLTHGLELLARDWGRETMRLAGVEGSAAWAYSMSMDLPWGEVIDAARPSFPADLRDLPWLIALADAERQVGHSASALAFGTLASWAPQIEAALNTQGQDRRAMLFEEMQIALPGPEAGYDERNEILIEIYSTGESFEESSFYRAMENYPGQDDLGQLLKQLALKEPQIRAMLSTRLDRMSEDERLDWLVRRLDVACGWSDAGAERGAAMVAAAAPGARDILLMAQMRDVLEFGGLLDYLGTYNGNHAPELLATLEAQGLSAEAEVLRQGIGMFPKPWVTDDSRRSEVLDEDENLWQQIYDIGMPEDSAAKLEAAMLRVAQGSGLLP